MFSTAPPPAVADAIEASLDIVEAEPERRQRVLANAAYLRRRLDEVVAVTPGDVADRADLIGDNDRAVAVAAAPAGGRIRRPRHPSAERPGRHGAPSRVGQRRTARRTASIGLSAPLASSLQEAGLCSAVSS